MARIGTVGYLNARPLSDQVDIDRHTLVLAHPAEVARMLRDREVDVALVPVAAVLAEPGYKIVPGTCVGSAGPVASVVLVADTPPEQWTRVVLDGVSRTSVVLAQLLLKHGPLSQRVSPDLKIELAPPNGAHPQVRKTTAALVIGDLARTVNHPHRIDLATEWREWTGLPFVFAVWAGRADLDPEVVRHLASAGRAGVDDVPRRYANGDLKYLTENLRYPLDDAALTGLRRFAALAFRAGLVPSEDFELFSPAARRDKPDVDPLLSRALDGGLLPPSDALALLRFAPVADLCAAADLKRRERFPGERVGLRLDAVLAADAGPESVADAVSAGATRIRLEGDVDEARVAAVAARWPGLELEAAAPVPGVTHLTEEAGGTWS
ncbi:MAG: MqnA/MqnD/SBP family protein, partial [Myxococcota bacterium]